MHYITEAIKYQSKIVGESMLVCQNNYEKDEPKMTREEKERIFERMLHNAPDIMTTPMVPKFAPFGKNKLHEILQNKQLKSYRYKNTRIIAKVDLIEYLVDHCEEPSQRTFKLKEGVNKQ